MNEQQITARIIISGLVQGIGFRYFVKSNARWLKLTGWVRNLDNDKVEVLAQGEKEKIEKLIKLCGQGPFLSEVKSLDVSWEKKKERFNDFKTIR
jgi:Acylphosphatases